MPERRKQSLRDAMVNQNSVIVDYLPEPLVPVLVHCEGFSCLAYIDRQGIWRSRYKNEPIPGRVIAWEPF